MSWTELEWQKLNAKLRIIIIVILLGILYFVWLQNSLDHCGECKFCDERTGTLTQLKEKFGIEAKRCVTAKDVMNEYAKTLVPKNATYNEQMAKGIEALSKAMGNITSPTSS